MLGRFFLLVVLTVGFTSGCNCGQSRPPDAGVSLLSPDSGELTVAVSIAGSGAVQGGAIACQADLDGDVDAGVCEWSTPSGRVALIAVAARGFEFSSWSCGGTEYRTPRIELDVSADTACTVTFTRLRPSLLVRIDDADGGAGGSVASSPSGISCGAGAGACTAAFDFGTEVTLTAQPAGDGGAVAFAGWSEDCVGTGLTTKVTVDAAKACTATFVSRVVTVRGLAGPHGAVAPSSARVLPGDPGVTLTATPDASRVAAWSGAFSSGSGTANGCTGASESVTVTVLEASPGAVYDCTATFQPQAHVTLRVVPAASALTTFGLVSGPCAIGDGASACEATVDTGELTLSATETTNEALQPLSRFVKWVCSNGWTSTSRSATTTIGAATTCVAQFYGLWWRYYEGPLSLSGDPNAVALAPGVDAGLPTSASSFIIEQNVSSEGTSLAGLVAADDEGGDGPTLTSWAAPPSDTGGWRISSNGDDAPAVVGWTTVGSWRVGLFGAYGITRDPGGVVSGLARSPLVALSYEGATSSDVYDSVLTTGHENAQGRHVLGGYSTRGNNAEGLFWNDTAAWVVLTDATGAPSTATRFLVPPTQDVECASFSSATATDVMWDPDPDNAGGVVVVGATFSAPCDSGTCPPNGVVASFVAKLSPNLEVLALRNLVSGVETNFVASKVLVNLSGTGYVVLGQYQDAFVGFVGVSYDLAELSDQVAVTAGDPESGSPLQTTLSDALVDADAGRYVVLATETDAVGQRDVVIMTLGASGQPRPNEGWAFGTTGMNEYAGRLVRPSEGGFLFTGQGPWGDSSNIAWVTRTDDGFNVPFNGSQPGVRRAALRYAVPISLPLTGGVNPCGVSVDPVSLSSSTLTTTPQTFTPNILIQAP